MKNSHFSTSFLLLQKNLGHNFLLCVSKLSVIALPSTQSGHAITEYDDDLGEDPSAEKNVKCLETKQK